MHTDTVAMFLKLYVSVVIWSYHTRQNKNNCERLGVRNTGLFISPSGISELDCARTKTDTAERSNQ